LSNKLHTEISSQGDITMTDPNTVSRTHRKGAQGFQRCMGSLAALTIFMGPAATMVSAQTLTYPNKPITLVVPFTPGGTTDILARIVGEGLGNTLKQSVIIDNRGGAGGNIGAAVVAKAPADGYTLLMGYNGTNAINPSLYKSTGWDPEKDFTPICMVARVNNVVIASPTFAANDLKGLARQMKEQPGQLNYGSAGAGSIFHLAGEMFEDAAGGKMTHVAYKGAAPALTDLLGGQIQLMFATIPAALPHIKAGKLKVLGVTGEKRSPLFPQSLTAKESGYPTMVVDSWFGIFGPKGLPSDVQANLQRSCETVLNSAETVKKMEDQGATPTFENASRLQAILKSDLQVWKQVIQKAKVSLD
jgi:tripartite-type tricarboxylate transporter receptor subunit TctC